MNNIFLSFLMVTLWSTVIALLLCIGRKQRIFLHGFGSEAVPALILVCAVRILFPFYSGALWKVRLKGIFADIYEVLALNKFLVFGIKVSVLNLVTVLLLAVAGILLIRFVIQYHRNMSEMRDLPKCSDERCYVLLRDICVEYGKKINVEVKQTEMVSTPMGAGIFHKVLLLPQKSYGDFELNCIIRHELMHFFQCDQLWMIFMCIFKNIFWWNPICSLLYREFLTSLEIRCDLRVTGTMQTKERVTYLKTIADAVKGSERTGGNSLSRGGKGTAAAFAGTYLEREVKERFLLIADQEEAHRRSWFWRVSLTGLLVGTMVLSFMVMLMPSYDPPEEDIYTDPGIVEITPENAYILLDADGKYYMMIDGVPYEIPEDFIKGSKQGGFQVMKEE